MGETRKCAVAKHDELVLRRETIGLKRLLSLVSQTFVVVHCKCTFFVFFPIKSRELFRGRCAVADETLDIRKSNVHVDFEKFKGKTFRFKHHHADSYSIGCSLMSAKEELSDV